MQCTFRAISYYGTAIESASITKLDLVQILEYRLRVIRHLQGARLVTVVRFHSLRYPSRCRTVMSNWTGRESDEGKIRKSETRPAQQPARQHSSQQPAHQRDRRVTPIGSAFPRYGEERMHDARPKVASGVDGVTGSTSQRETDSPNQTGHE